MEQRLTFSDICFKISTLKSHLNPPMPAEISPLEEANKTKLDQVKSTLILLYGRTEIQCFSDPDEALVKVRRQTGNKFLIKFNQAKIHQVNTDSCLAQAVSAIETLQTQANLRARDELQDELKTYEEHQQIPAFDLLYRAIYQNIALRKKSIELPALHQTIVKISKSFFFNLSRKVHPLPKHLQYLLALADLDDIEIEDEQVKRAITGLKTSGIFRSLFDHRQDEGEILKLIHQSIFPPYKYFLRRDKKQWKPEKRPPQETEEETREKVKEALETPEEEDPQEKSEAPPPSPPAEQTEGSPEQSEEEKSTPDYQDEYNTPEGGSMEKDPEGKGYKLEVSPALQGYYSIDRKSFFNHQAMKWSNQSQLSHYRQNPSFTGKKYTISGKIIGKNLKPLPIPVGYAFDINSIQASGDNPTIYRDQNGCFTLQLSGQGKCELSIDFYKEEDPVNPQTIPEDSELMYSGALSSKAEQALSSARQANTVKDKALTVLKYIRKNHFYPPGKNSQEQLEGARQIQEHLQKISNGNNYIHNLDSSTHLECYSANTLFIAMLRTIGIAARMVIGHKVDSLNRAGHSEINASNCHGWCELWNGSRWVRFDATPPFDPNDPKNHPDPQEEEDEEKQEQSEQNPEKADDGGEDIDHSEDEGPSPDNSSPPPDKEEKSREAKEEVDHNEPSPSPDKEGEKSDSEKGGGPQEEAQEEVNEDFDPEAEFEKMYQELQENLAETPEKEEVEEAKEQVQREKVELEQKDPDEVRLQNKYPQLPPEEIERLAQFVKKFRSERKNIEQIKNPDHPENSDNETLAEELRSIYDGVISRSIGERDVPRFPVSDGYNLELWNPVQLHLDRQAGLTESYAFMERETQEFEEMKIIKVRRRKILDGSGSMSPEWGGGNKLKIQQQIEVLDNFVTAQKQEELNEMSERLNRDVRLETETWQFGIQNPQTNQSFSRLKAMSSEFDELEQAAIWQLAGETGSVGTNDFEALECIYELLLDENTQMEEDEPTVLERIRAGFYIREITAYKHLSQKTEDELTAEERVYLRNLETNIENTREWLEELQGEYPVTIEPILEVIEISSDGGSNNPVRLQRIVKKLRDLGVIVICYGLGSDGKAAVRNYRNDYNPMEGGLLCTNLLDYPQKKARAWQNILDKV